MEQVFLIDLAQDGEQGGFLFVGNDLQRQFFDKLTLGSLFPGGLLLDFESRGEHFALLHAVQAGFGQAFEQDVQVNGFAELVGGFLSLRIDHADLGLQLECEA